jgi:hypothetical protein
MVRATPLAIQKEVSHAEARSRTEEFKLCASAPLRDLFFSAVKHATSPDETE